LDVNTKPFFIIGCVRSGTTLLRDVLRKHPNLASPEETHFFRWSEPFGTNMGLKPLLSNPVLKKHRELDGITEAEFRNMLNASASRAELCAAYMRRYIRIKKPEATRWFDKTPQNVYGAAMIATEFPGSKFLHIVRNPLDVVSSLRIGKIVKVENLVGACNYWNESAEILHVLKRAFPKRVYEVKYEDFTRDLLQEVKKIAAFVGEEFKDEYLKGINTKPKQHEHTALFSPEEMSVIAKLCGRWAKHYGYILNQEQR
jgi:sulfotransferase family protein